MFFSTPLFVLFILPSVLFALLLIVPTMEERKGKENGEKGEDTLEEWGKDNGNCDGQNSKLCALL